MVGQSVGHESIQSSSSPPRRKLQQSTERDVNRDQENSNTAPPSQPHLDSLKSERFLRGLLLLRVSLSSSAWST